jgi:hypothetical protein
MLQKHFDISLIGWKRGRGFRFQVIAPDRNFSLCAATKKLCNDDSGTIFPLLFLRKGHFCCPGPAPSNNDEVQVAESQNVEFL